MKKKNKQSQFVFFLRWLNSIYWLSGSEGAYGRKTRTIQADFTDGNTIYPAIAQGLHGLEIGILGKCVCGQ